MLVVWRVVALATPPWPRWCPRCGVERPFASTGKFRVNAQGARHDVWLLYGCPGCAETARRRLERRVRAAEIGPGLVPYLENDQATAWAHAFDLGPQEELPSRTDRPPITPGDGVAARIEQPWPCAVRWDRFLARELGLSRTRVAAAWKHGHLRIATGALSHPVRDGVSFELAPAAWG